jgi:predicted AAA+ superfamily ATPase
MWIPRAVEPRLRRSAKTRPVVVLTGARQTGKTSTFLRLFPKHAFVSLDLPAEAEQAEKEPDTFLQRHPPPVLIDEVQYAPGLFRHLKVAVMGPTRMNSSDLTLIHVTSQERRFR